MRELRWTYEDGVRTRMERVVVREKDVERGRTHLADDLHRLRTRVGLWLGGMVRARMSAPAEKSSMKTGSTRATRRRESRALGKEMGMGEGLVERSPAQLFVRLITHHLPPIYGLVPSRPDHPPGARPATVGASRTHPPLRSPCEPPSLFSPSCSLCHSASTRATLLASCSARQQITVPADI